MSLLVYHILFCAPSQVRDMNRRRYLGVAGGLLPALSGCLGGEAAPSTATDAPTTPAETSGPLSFDVAVGEQSAVETPATIRTTLTNTGENAVEVGTGPTLVFRTENAFEYGLLLYPQTNIGPNTTPDGRTDGCWRYTDERFLVRDVREWQRLEPEGTMEELHHVYTVGTDPLCLPEGEYPFVDEVAVDDESRLLELTVTLSIDKHGRMAAAPGAKIL